MAQQFKQAILGGTFDHLHIGHKTLLKEAFVQSEKVIVGIASEELFRGKFLANVIETYHIREASVIEYLATNNFLSRATIIPITDIYGNSLTEKTIDAIFVTEDSLANVQKINNDRAKRGFVALTVVQVPLQLGNDGEVVASSRIRNGEIDRDGNAYKGLLTQKEQFLLPHSLREAFRKPIGPIFADIDAVLDARHSGGLTITVGDVVTLSCIRRGRQADISIVDLQTRRNRISIEDQKDLQAISYRLETQNQHGTIERSAIKTLQNALANYFSMQKKQLIIVAGEEDLLVMPMILLAPLQSLVIYGQYNMGIVGVTVTEEKKKEIAALFRKFV